MENIITASDAKVLLAMMNQVTFKGRQDAALITVLGAKLESIVNFEEEDGDDVPTAPESGSSSAE